MSNDSRLALNARLEPVPHPPTPAQRKIHDCELAHHGTDVAEPVDEGAKTEIIS